jgi:hypothetical protein
VLPGVEDVPPDDGPGLVWKEWWCNFVSGIMMPKFLPAVKSAARFLSKGMT